MFMKIVGFFIYPIVLKIYMLDLLANTLLIAVAKGYFSSNAENYWVYIIFDLVLK